MSRASFFLEKTVDGAQKFANGGQMNWWKGSCVSTSFADPLPPDRAEIIAEVANKAENKDDRSQSIQSQYEPVTVDHSILGGSVVTHVSQHPNTSGLPNPSFGAILAEIFLILSVLSKQDGPLRLPALSNLHSYPLLGNGISFIARLVPASSLKVDDPSLKDVDNVVFKSLRHREPDTEGKPRTGDRRVIRLQNFLRELRVLTHSPLRNHENIVRLIGVGWEANRLSISTSVFHWPFLVLEHAQCGTLINWLDENTSDFGMRKALVLDVGLGLQALHSCDVIHGDMKPENVLVFVHPKKRYIAKIADFGFTMFDLDGRAPTMHYPGGTKRWDAPESEKALSWKSRLLTDVYSYGFLVWRTMGFGHAPFDNLEGLPSPENTALINNHKKPYGALLTLAEDTLAACIKDTKILTMVTSALNSTLQFDPRHRNLDTCLKSLGSKASSPRYPALRHSEIPPEQGLGIYEYGGENQRLKQQLHDSLESHYLYASACDQEISASSQTLLFNGAATLASEYLDRHFAGDINHPQHKSSNLCIGFSWLTVSAGARSTASAESIVPISRAFDCDDQIPNPRDDHFLLFWAASEALKRGSEFILRDVMENDVRGKEEFLHDFRTKLCRGVGFRLSISKAVFNGTGGRYNEFLGKPFYLRLGADPAKPDGHINPDYLLRIASGWGALKDVQLLVRKHRANLDAKSANEGETALLTACRAGHVDVVQWLIAAGANASITTHNNVSPFHWINSFPKTEVMGIAKLLKFAKGDPNAVMKETWEGAESGFWFFRGPPLMRVVASGNLEGVEALLALGADPLITRVASIENPLIFALRRGRLNIVKALVKKTGTEILWKRQPSGARYALHIIGAHSQYLAKIHSERFVEAMAETFDYVWSLADPKERQLYSLDSQGTVPIQVAVREGNFLLVKRMIECESGRNSKELVATIGMQAAILHRRFTIFKYLLDSGGQALHPFLDTDSGEPVQFMEYVRCPWNFNLVAVQRKTNSLHLCISAGDMGQRMCYALLRAELPPSRWDVTPETMRKRDQINCCCNSKPTDDPIVDSRNERGETPFFCALKVEEYQIAWTLYEAGANKNVIIPLAGHANSYGSALYTAKKPLVEHALEWVSAYRALHFLIHFCWGCLQLTNPHGGDFRLAVIPDVARLPYEEAGELFRYVQERAYPTHTWNREILEAIRVLNTAAVDHLLRTREKLIPGHRDPTALFETAMAALLDAFQKDAKFDSSNTNTIQQSLRKRAEVTFRLTSIIASIEKSYPDDKGGCTADADFLDHTWKTVRPEFNWRLKRYKTGLINLVKLENELDQQLFPWMVLLSIGRKEISDVVLEGFQEILEMSLKPVAAVTLDNGRVKLTATGPSVQDSKVEEASAKPYFSRASGSANRPVVASNSSGSMSTGGSDSSRQSLRESLKRRSMVILPKRFRD
ncbi:hypothetical protein BCR34DRAFT_659639 [Clohesyomyces aquaticus]|uniref:Protein kinase domain-containing protein n=1 Tax=Clohesyomyces aquaticus TaxID=1231657 RepID=A0A1Y2ABP6_9PLEO|nr:hypothetical protein BCR34DRAFT_659639 [Clohesyomyces aquaticus]